jgi:hypothetical protein
MDWRSHRLFGGLLLEKIGKDINYDSWSLVPDVDIGPLHRWHRHRFSVMSSIYTEGLYVCRKILEERHIDRVKIRMQITDEEGSAIENDKDKDAIVLCVTSHFYLDMFSGFIAPFGILYPIFPNKTVTRDILENENGPKILIKELKNLPITDEFSTKFYGGSRTIMNEFVSDMVMFNLEDIVCVMVYRMCTHAHMNKRGDLYNKAISDIYSFTGNKKYVNNHVRSWKDGFDKFEHKYAKLINKFTEFL